jgi:predicted RNase H-like nuclease
MYTFVGFDSAWADSIKAPGALCAVTVADGAPVRFHSPRLASFDQALDFIQEIGFDSKFLLIALDQPTVVPNMASMRPVERVAASLVSWLGGGVQPANRKPLGMFCDAAPIWKFLKTLDAIQDPEQARVAAEGRYLIEVFPSLALASIAPESFGRLKGLRYNPGRKKTFRVADWVAAASAATKAAQILGFDELAQWCAATARIAQPRKSRPGHA